MGKMHELISKIKTPQKYTTIYMISSSNSYVDLEKVKEFPEDVRDYFMKPVSYEDICKIFV